VPPNTPSRLPVEDESPQFHGQCGCPKSNDAENDDEFEFRCEIPAGCHHQDQKSADLARKCVSDYFGRNKKCTEMIPHQIIWCRAHYQAAQYQQDVWRFQKIGLIDEQFLRNEKYILGLRYTVTLKVSEAVRLDNYVARVRPARKAAHQTKRGQNYEAHPEVLRYIEERWMGEHKSMEHCQSLLRWSYSAIKRSFIEQMPMVVFLPEFAELGRHKLQKNQANSVQRGDDVIGPRGHQPGASDFDEDLLNINISGTEPLSEDDAMEVDEDETESEDDGVASPSTSTLSAESPPPPKRCRKTPSLPVSHRLLRSANRHNGVPRTAVHSRGESSSTAARHNDPDAIQSALNFLRHASGNIPGASALLRQFDRAIGPKK
jgi:hypothetical protein